MSEVLDASAILAVVQSETGAEVVLEAIPDGVISVVNISEVVAKLTDRGYRDDAIRKELRELNLAVKDFDEDQAYAAGMLRPLTRDCGLSLGDRACIALGLRLGLAVLTADRSWAGLDVGVDVRLVR
jgi:PIN domain nuclease of toxin-antitoxin system